MNRLIKISTLSVTLFWSSLSVAQVVTPEAPEPTASDDNITIELSYVGVAVKLTDAIALQGYGAYGFDDDIGLGLFDAGYTFNEYLSAGGRYQYFYIDGGSDQHSVWGYVNAQIIVASSWRFDTRQVVEERFSTSGVTRRTRYRPRVRASYLSSVFDQGYQLYASIEPILNLTDDDDNQTSYAGGGFLQLTDHLQLNVFYQFTVTETGPDFHFPGLGLFASY